MGERVCAPEADDFPVVDRVAEPAAERDVPPASMSMGAPRGALPSAAGLGR